MQTTKLYLYFQLLVALLIGAIYYAALYPLWSSETLWLKIDSVVFTTTLFFLLIILKAIIGTQVLSQLEWKQRTINFIVLGCLFVLMGLGINTLYTYYFTPIFSEAINYIGVKAIIWTLLYGCSVQAYINYFTMDIRYQELSIEEDIDENSKATNSLIEKNTTETEANNEGELSDNNDIIERISIKDGNKIEIIPVEDIVHIQANGDYVMIHTFNNKFIKEQTMKCLEESLPNSIFVRVHRSSIVNITYISQMELYGKQSQILKLSNGVQIKISANGYKRLKRILHI